MLSYTSDENQMIFSAVIAVAGQVDCSSVTS